MGRFALLLHGAQRVHTFMINSTSLLGGRLSFAVPFNVILLTGLMYVASLFTPAQYHGERQSRVQLSVGEWQRITLFTV